MSNEKEVHVTESNKQSHKLGETLEVKDNVKVYRPNGEEHTVSGGYYVLDVAGVHVIDGEEITVK